MISEWKLALALYLTLAIWRLARECGRMVWWEREGFWFIAVSRAAIVLLLWAGIHLWKWASA